MLMIRRTSTRASVRPRSFPNTSRNYSTEKITDCWKIRTVGYVLAFFGLLMFMFGICALRTNVVFVTLFALILSIAEILAAAYWSLAEGSVEHAEHLLKVRRCCCRRRPKHLHPADGCCTGRRRDNIRHDPFGILLAVYHAVGICRLSPNAAGWRPEH